MWLPLLFIAMRYEGDIYRPPSEAYSLLIQVTIGCAHNDCTFCTMFRGKKFRLRSMDEIFEDLELARKTYKYVRRIFLCDGDALCIKTEKLVEILNKIHSLFPECERVGIYGTATDINRKMEQELEILRDAGLGIIYLGAESGSDEVLRNINKKMTRADIVKAVNKSEDIGIPVSVTLISGLAGKEGMREHALGTARLITEMNASYVSLLTLLLDDAAPIMDDVRAGRLTLLSPKEVLEETKLIIENANPKRSCVFRSNHASNYLPLRGNLPDDRDALIEVIELGIKHMGMLKDDRFRRL